MDRGDNSPSTLACEGGHLNHGFPGYSVVSGSVDLFRNHDCSHLPIAIVVKWAEPQASGLYRSSATKFSDGCCQSNERYR